MADRTQLIQRLVKARHEGRCTAADRNRATMTGGANLESQVQAIESAAAGSCPTIQPLTEEEIATFKQLFERVTGGIVPQTPAGNSAIAWIWELHCVLSQHTRTIEQLLANVPPHQRSQSNPLEFYEYHANHK